MREKERKKKEDKERQERLFGEKNQDGKYGDRDGSFSCRLAEVSRSDRYLNKRYKLT